MEMDEDKPGLCYSSWSCLFGIWYWKSYSTDHKSAEDVYKLIPTHFKFPKDLSRLTKDVALLLLECIRYLRPAATGLTKKIVCQPWMKTNGFKCPSESLLSSHIWGHLVNVGPLPIIDEAYYSRRVRSYMAELEAIEVAINPDQFSVNCEFEKLGLEDSLIGKPSIKIILAFLANPLINIPVEERQNSKISN
ncbi:hypothetical protein LOK49_LG01G03111 [Camellia lanceoleosa]|uniref:Uncharacterized protein n=1 Tax=Camellia lanceoleosa TaxID=1840588 RepID=A0ACC0J0H4_9ERIC|nr:hypothetical protein LOK49_LG01G03111 [Camellia lanceoleosa]